MTAIRDCRAGDHDEVVELSLRAWAPVFASVDEILGPELARLLHGQDWREYQAAEVRAALHDSANRVWVAEHDGRVAGPPDVSATAYGEGTASVESVSPCSTRLRRTTI